MSTSYKVIKDGLSALGSKGVGTVSGSRSDSRSCDHSNPRPTLLLPKLLYTDILAVLMSL